jgi:entericidin B
MLQLFRTVARIALVCAAVSAVSACNTIEGLGKDIKQAGQSIENAADRKK